MTTLADRPNTALLVVDVQNGVVAEAYHRDDVVHRIAQLVDRAREHDVAVVWVQHEEPGHLDAGTDAWRLVPELQPGEGEPTVHKRYGDAFEDTDLESVLASRGVGRLVVTGAQTEACVRSTLHGALVRGYDTTLVSDAHTGEDIRPWGGPSPADVHAFLNLAWSFTSAPGRTTEVVTAEEVAF